MSATTDLYRIVVGSTVWTLTSGSRDVVYSGEYYVSTPMGRGGITIRNELTKANLEVRLPLDHALTLILLGAWLEQVVTMTVFRQKPTGTAVIWKGRLTSTIPGDADARLIFESIYTSLRRPGLRARFQKSCRHPLYGRGCLLNPESFAFAGTVTAISGRTLTIASAATKPAGYFVGGMIKAPDGTLSYVTSHAGNQIGLNRLSGSLSKPFALSGSVAVSLYPGCPHDYASCRDKFNNDANYGGFDYIPTKSPMNGSSIV